MHSGSTNAFTEHEKTTYFFDMNVKEFPFALKMFSRMFANPLFDKTLMNKEINAVSSENDKNLNSESWRQNELIKLLSNEEHPFHHFSTGNKETLGGLGMEELHKRLVRFYNKYYVPKAMKLAVLSTYLIFKFR